MNESMNPKVNFYFEKEKRWGKEIELMRSIALECGLTEELKWGTPCYMHHDYNIVLIHTFKEYCAFLFFKGALLKDPKKILIQQSENVQSARQLRFTKIAEITKLKAVIKAYIFEAIEIEKAGLKVVLKKVEEYKVAEEFQLHLDKMSGLKKAFDKLTPGRRRAYFLFFAAPKQSKTREARVLKCIPMIMEGKGLND